MNEASGVVFAPQVYLPHGTRDGSFYTNAFGAVLLRQFINDDDTIHVAEFSIDGTLFHLHEESSRVAAYCPATVNGTTTMIGLFVPDVDAVMQQAIASGATEVTPAQDYDYGYRQGEIKDPFGHLWLIEKKI